MRDERGFTLPEVLAALVVLTIIITGSFAAFLERNHRLQQAAEIMLAYQALANEAEYQRRIQYTLLSDSTAFLSDTALLAPLGDPGTSVKVDEVETGVCNVTMTVRWRNGERLARLTLVRVDTGGLRLW
ncbi:MAG TPA: type II secretion system protein [Thermoanaerobaculia bacterium]|nr:type II secretion system protein [Thermoanaerobaculia bacterium]